MSSFGIVVTVTCGFVVQLCTIAILYCMGMEKRQTDRRQRAIEDSRHEAIVLRLDAIFAKLTEGDR